MKTKTKLKRKNNWKTKTKTKNKNKLKRKSHCTDAGSVGSGVNGSRSSNPDVPGPMLAGYERQRLLAVGCGSLVAGATLVALITFATDRCHVCVRRRRRSAISASYSTCRRPRFAKPEPETVATPPSLSSQPATENQVSTALCIVLI